MTFLKQFENLRFFTKQDLLTKFTGTDKALDQQIARALKTKKLLSLKKGLYTTAILYLNEADKTRLTEYFASQIYTPSYLIL